MKILPKLLCELQQCLAIIMCIFIGIFQSCINNISDENDNNIYGKSDTYINLFTSLSTEDKAPYNNFMDDDAIGVYITVQPSTLEKSRYIDNAKFTYSTANNFIPEEEIYFPEGKTSCDFISYFPYQKNAIEKGSSTIEIEVQKNQSSPINMSNSNFMIATAKGITTSTNPVALNFEHKLSCINIQLKPSSGYTLEMLLEADPVVKIRNVYTKATYNFTDNTFTNQHTKSDIIPFGTWYIKDDMLCGKSAIIIPQSLPDSHTIIELYLGNRVFQCQREENLPIESGTFEDNTITLYSSDNATKTQLSVQVNNWIHTQVETEAKEVSDFLDISTLSFEKTKVYKIMHKETQVAEVALEYLCTDELEEQAIVVYPCTNGKADLSNGLVAEIKDKAQDIHGGTVSWDSTDNTLSYIPGNSVPIRHIYISTDGEINTTRHKESLAVEATPDMLTDIRGTETFEYPVVKIGTQYWMHAMCKSLKYIDGTDIELGKSEVQPTAQYYHYKNAYIFYNAPVIATKRITPDGWRICSEKDVTQLKTYVKNNASVLKSDSETTWGNSRYPFTNLTGFYAVATGFYNIKYTDIQVTAGYWCVSGTTLKAFTLDINSNDIKFMSTTNNMAFSIKYIRE